MIVPAGLAFNNLLTAFVVVAALFFARDILVPIALAILLSFLLTPAVRWLQRWHLPKPVSVLGTVIFALAITLSLAAMVVLEGNQLVSNLPRYQATLASKVHNLQDAMAGPGILKTASGLLKNLDNELNKEKRGAPDQPAKLTRDQPSGVPIPVEVHQPMPGASEALVAMLKPLAAPFTTTAIVVVFLIFFLFQREDLRDRFIRISGSRDLERTTAALDDAGRRLSRLFVTQLLLNACFGTVIGLGLALIGVPSAPLWGLLAMLLRFVPYVGAILAAALPISLAAAVGEDWAMTLWTVALFAVAQPITGQVLEPLLCGRSAGLSPVAVVIAASFWTWLWGPLGLLLSTPLTLCLVVFARHIDRLHFLDVMLGDQPALTPQQAAYQRMLTGDPVEAIEQARQFLKDNAVPKYYEVIMLGALRLAQKDAERGRLDDERLENIVQTVTEIIEDLAEYAAEDIETEEANSLERQKATSSGQLVSLRPGRQVACIPGLGRLDSCAVLMVADLLRRERIDARIATADEALKDQQAAVLCLVYLEEVSDARVAYHLRRLIRGNRNVGSLVCLLNQQEPEDDEPSGKSQKDKPRIVRSIAAMVAAVRSDNGVSVAAGPN